MKHQKTAAPAEPVPRTPASMTKRPTCGQWVKNERYKLEANVFVWTMMSVLIWGMVLFLRVERRVLQGTLVHAPHDSLPSQWARSASAINSYVSGGTSSHMASVKQSKPAVRKRPVTRTVKPSTRNGRATHRRATWFFWTDPGLSCGAALASRETTYLLNLRNGHYCDQVNLTTFVQRIRAHEYADGAFQAGRAGKTTPTQCTEAHHRGP